MNKKGSALDLIIVVTFILVAGFMLFLGRFVTVEVADAMMASPAINTTPQAVQSLQDMKDLTSQYDKVNFAFFIGMVLVFWILGYLIGGIPIFMFFYFLFVVFAVFISAILANVWEHLTIAPVWGGNIASFPITNEIMLRAPFYIGAIGMIGLILMFAKPRE